MLWSFEHWYPLRILELKWVLEFNWQFKKVELMRFQINVINNPMNVKIEESEGSLKLEL